MTLDPSRLNRTGAAPHSDSLPRTAALERSADALAARALPGQGPTRARTNPRTTPGPGAMAQAAAAVRAGGTPLPTEDRGRYERRFGHDFSDVRIHRDNRAGSAARAIGARAFAYGNDVGFAPGTGPQDDATMAHELAHVVQYRTGAMGAPQVLRDETGATPPAVGANDVFPFQQGDTIQFRELLTRSLNRQALEGLLDLASGIDSVSGMVGPARTVLGYLFDENVPRTAIATVDQATADAFRVTGRTPEIPGGDGRDAIPATEFSLAFLRAGDGTFTARLEAGGDVHEFAGIEAAQQTDGSVQLRVNGLPVVDSAEFRVARGDDGSLSVTLPELPPETPAASLVEMMMELPLQIIGVQQVTAEEAEAPAETGPAEGASTSPVSLGVAAGTLAQSGDAAFALTGSFIYTFRPIGPLIDFPLTFSLGYIAPRGVSGSATIGTGVTIPTSVPVRIQFDAGVGAGTLDARRNDRFVGPQLGAGIGLRLDPVDLMLNYSAVIDLLDRDVRGIHTFGLGAAAHF